MGAEWTIFTDMLDTSSGLDYHTNTSFEEV